MKKTAFAVLFASAIGIAYCAELNVRDFGAKGDGVADDTAAFNAAGAVMLKQAMSGATLWGTRNRAAFSGSVEEPRPELLVPKGRYLIKGTIVMCTCAARMARNLLEEERGPCWWYAKKAWQNLLAERS